MRSAQNLLHLGGAGSLFQLPHWPRPHGAPHPPKLDRHAATSKGLLSSSIFPTCGTGLRSTPARKPPRTPVCEWADLRGASSALADTRGAAALPRCGAAHGRPSAERGGLRAALLWPRKGLPKRNSDILRYPKSKSELSIHQQIVFRLFGPCCTLTCVWFFLWCVAALCYHLPSRMFRCQHA